MEPRLIWQIKMINVHQEMREEYKGYSKYIKHDVDHTVIYIVNSIKRTVSWIVESPCVYDLLTFVEGHHNILPDWKQFYTFVEQPMYILDEIKYYESGFHGENNSISKN